MSGELKYLAESYFHQDFDLDAPTPIDIIREFRDAEAPAVVDQLVTEIESILELTSEGAMRTRWISELHAYYEPERDGLTYRQWFAQVLAALREPK